MSGEYDWEKIRKFRTMLEGIKAMQELFKDNPKVVLSTNDEKEFQRIREMQNKFYELPIEDRIKVAGI